MKKTILLIFLTFFFFLYFNNLEAQTTGLRIDYFTDYHLNPIFYNPAFAGEESHPMIGVSGRNLKNGVSEPYSFQGFIHGQIEAIKSGVGLMVNYHSFGDIYKRRQMKVGLLYSYTIQAGEKGRFKLGLNSSLLHYNSNFVPNSGSVDVVKTNESFFKFNLDGSVLYLNGDFYMGATIFHTNEPNFEFYNIGGNNRFQKEAYLSMGTQIGVNENITLHPAAMLNFSLNQFSGSFNNQGYIDLSLLAKFHDKYLAGISYKMNQPPYKIALTAGVKLAEKYQVAATYHLKQSANYLNRSRVGVTFNYFLVKEEEAPE
ncbi:MAG: PorP/SprF family type IX secretion system membrane protein [Chitinophagales bacterium]